MSVNRVLSSQFSTVVVQDETYPDCFMKNLTKMHDEISEEFSDVTLLVEGVAFPTHKIVLSCFSEYFRSLFRMETGPQVSLQLPHGVGSEIFRLVLHFAYTGIITLTTDNAQDVLITANFFGCESLSTKVQSFMVSYMDDSNAIDLLELGITFSMSFLQDEASKFIMLNLNSFLVTTEGKCPLFRCSIDFIEKVLQYDGLILRHSSSRLLLGPEERERTVVNIIADYVNQSEEEATNVGRRLLRNCVKWTLLTEKEEEASLLERSNHPFWKVEVEEQLKIARDLRDGLRKIRCDCGGSFLRMYTRRQCNKPCLKQSSEGCTRQDVFFTCDGDKCYYCLQCVKNKMGKNALSSESLTFSLTLRALSFPIDIRSQPVAHRNEVGRPSTEFVVIAKMSEFITEIVTTTRLWDGREVLRSLELVFSSGLRFVKGGEGDIENTKRIRLESGEHITDAYVAAGWMVDALGFTMKRMTENGESERVVEAFVGGGGAIRDAKSRFNETTATLMRSTKATFAETLVGFAGGVVMTQGQGGITHLSFIWRNMTDNVMNWTDKERLNIPHTDSFALLLREIDPTYRTMNEWQGRTRDALDYELDFYEDMELDDEEGSDSDAFSDDD